MGLYQAEGYRVPQFHGKVCVHSPNPVTDSHTNLFWTGEDAELWLHYLFTLILIIYASETTKCSCDGFAFPDLIQMFCILFSTVAICALPVFRGAGLGPGLAA